MELPPATASMTLLVGAVIVHDVERARVLMLRRGPEAKFGQGLWDLPVGKVDPGEPVTAAAVRELAEETGVVVAQDDLALAGVVHGAWGVESPNGFLTVVFAARAWTGEPGNREPEKHDTVAWVDADALPEPLVPSAGEVVGNYLAAHPPRVTLRGWPRG